MTNRNQRRRIAREKTAEFTDERASRNPFMSRRERREFQRRLTARVLKEAPRDMFDAIERPSSLIERPRIIVPQIEVQADGIDTSALQQDAPSDAPQGAVPRETRTPAGVIILA